MEQYALYISVVNVLKDGRHRLNRSGSGQRQVAGSCECGDEPSGSIKYGEFLE